MVVIYFDLNSPFVYLHTLAQGANGSAQKAKGGLNKFLSSPPDWNQLEPPTSAVGQFIEMLSFPQRHKLDELPYDLVEVNRDGSF